MSFAEIVYQRIVPFVDGALIPLLYALAFLFFLIGVVRFLFSMEEEKRKEGKQFVLWSLIGLFVLFAVWGLVRVLLSILVGA